MPASKRVNLESLLSKEEAEQFKDIRVEEIPEKRGKLGQGGFGDVFLFKFKNGSLCAGKRPTINLLHSSQEDERQLKKHLLSALGEIKTLHHLSHERIIKFHGFYLDQNQIIIFMEQMRGSVKDEISGNKNLTEMEAIRYFTQAAEGLVYLHGQKPKPIIHRNIKCKNLLLTTQYNVKLADFGLATYLAQSNSLQIYLSNTPSSIAGTYRFTAPEIIINQMTPEAYCRESDVWSLACTLVEMISGHPPYKEVDFIEFVERSSNTLQNPLKFSGDILLPRASYAIRALLNSLFITDYLFRPDAKSTLNLAHDATTFITNTIFDASAQCKVGFMYMIRRDLPQSDEEAAKWYRKAAEQGDAEGQNNLGFMHHCGRGVPQSDRKAAKWYRKAAEQGYAEGQNNLGVMYASGRGVLQSNEEAAKWYRKAAEQGDAGGQLNLGFMYQRGQGVPHSYKEAVKWYRKAAEQGDAGGQRNLGLMYEKGRGVPQSDREAVKWYRKSAEQGNALAQRNLGLMYENGRGLPRSHEKAVKWYKKAAKQGNADAERSLRDLQKREQGLL